MLRQELYRGVVIWNRSQKLMRAGTKTQRVRPEAEWWPIEAPELRIVPEELWVAAEKRGQDAWRSFPRSREGGRLLGRPARLDGESPYLLTGFTACSICGGAIGGATQYHGTGSVEQRKRVTFYLCTTRRKRGECICTNDVVVKTAAVDAEVIKTISAALSPELIEAAIEHAMALYEVDREQGTDRRASMKRELDAVDARLGRRVEALVKGGPLDSIVEQMKIEEELKRSLTADYDALDTALAPTPLDPADIRREVAERAPDVRGVLSRQTAQVRQMLRKLLDGKIQVEPVTIEGQRGFRLSGKLNVGRLLRADVLRVIDRTTSDESNSLAVVAPTGFEPVFESRSRPCLS
jgi:site-specific DNA recombinase